MKTHRLLHPMSIALALTACGEAEPPGQQGPMTPMQPVQPVEPMQPEVDATGLVAYFPLDGDSRDRSGRGHDGVLLGATPTADRHGDPDSALGFDGMNDGVAIPDSADFDLSNGDFTIAFWMRSAGSEGLTGLVSHGPDGGGVGWGITGDADVPPGMFIGGDFVGPEGLSPTLGVWTHLSYVRHGTSVDLIVDGTRYPLGDVTMTAGPGLAELRLGFLGVEGIPGHFEGALDDLVIFTRALDEAELSILREGGSKTLVGAHTPRPIAPLGEDLTWTPCPLFTQDEASLVVDCTIAPTQLDPSDAAAGRHPYFVKRVPAQDAPRAQIWLLSGGPGFNGETLEGLARMLQLRSSDTEIYIPDHRGTGRSLALRCDNEEAPSSEHGRVVSEAELSDCVASLERLHGRRMPHLNMSNQARDLSRMIELTRRPDVPVFVYGLSYGGRLALRYLELFANQADGLILDSPLLPGHFVDAQESWVNEAGQTLMQMCVNDVGCAAKFPASDPWVLTQSVKARLDAGHCPALGIDGLVFGRLLGRLLLSGTAVRSLVPAVVYRADRCDDGDVDALSRLLASAFPDVPGQPRPEFAPSLNMHILLSELLPQDLPSRTEFEARERQLTMSAGHGVDLADVASRWPRYTPEHDNTWPALSVPLLVLQSEIDPNTAPSLIPQLQARFTRADQQVVMFPHANHAVAYHSRTATRDSCGADLMTSFIADRTGVLDTSCAAEHLIYDFEIEPSLNRQLFGTSSRWEN